MTLANYIGLGIGCTINFVVGYILGRRHATARAVKQINEARIHRWLR